MRLDGVQRTAFTSAAATPAALVYSLAARHGDDPILSFVYTDYLHWGIAPTPRCTLPLRRGRCAVVLFVVYFSAFFICFVHSLFRHACMHVRLFGRWLSFVAAFVTFLVGKADFLFVVRLLFARLLAGASAGVVTASAFACLLLSLL